MNDPTELSSSPSDPLQVGAIVAGRYELRRVLGRGAAAVVFAAEHVRVRRAVALKVPLLDPNLRELLCARLRQETDALSCVRHPAIVDVIDAGESDGLPFLAMELLEGRTLSGLIAARGTLHPDEVLKVGIDLADGLGAVHAAGIVHRDVKPSNVLVTRLAANQVHLCDFGIAKLMGPAQVFDSKLTQSGSIVGTPEYMPFESLLATGIIDHRVDVYGLGITLFECLTGVVPVEGTLAQILIRLSTTKLPSIAEIRPDVPQGLASVVSRCIAHDPAARFASMSELSAALRACAPQPPETVDLLRATKPPLIVPVAVALTSTVSPEARREHARAPYVTVATLQREGGLPTDARIEDVSQGGVLLITQQPYAAGEVVRLRYSLPISGRVVALLATVRWVRKARGAPATGLEFKELPEAARNEIRQYVALMIKGRN